MKYLPSPSTLFGFGLYVAFTLCIVVVAGDSPSTEQWLGIILSQLLLLLVDLRSFRQGLDCGTKIAHNILDDLLKQYRK